MTRVAPKFKQGDDVTLVKGPGYALQPEHRNVGKAARVLDVLYIGSSRQPSYHVEVLNGRQRDTVDAACVV